MEHKLELQTPSAVEIIEVIHVLTTCGNGTKGNPFRAVHQYWDKKGNLLAEKDED